MAHISQTKVRERPLTSEQILQSLWLDVQGRVGQKLLKNVIQIADLTDDCL